MGLITNILFPVDFSPSCIAMAAYVKRAATLFRAKVSLIHVFDPSTYNTFELYLRPASEVAEEHEGIARDRLNSFLSAEFDPSEHPRILAAGDAATQIAEGRRICEIVCVQNLYNLAHRDDDALIGQLAEAGTA